MGNISRGEGFFTYDIFPMTSNRYGGGKIGGLALGVANRGLVLWSWVGVLLAPGG